MSGQQTTTAVVWKMNADKSVEPVQIKLGITDHTTTEVAQVVKGSLNPQDQVVTGSASGQQDAGCDHGGPGNGRGAWRGRRWRKSRPVKIHHGGTETRRRRSA